MGLILTSICSISLQDRAVLFWLCAFLSYDRSVLYMERFKENWSSQADRVIDEFMFNYIKL